jgi:alpha-L-fucosidase
MKTHPAITALLFSALSLHPPGLWAAAGDASGRQRMDWWREARFGLFIHWGAVTVLDAQWKGKRTTGDPLFALQKTKAPVAGYAQALSAFNPVNYDPESWVLLARQAGARYIVFTAKHHDGFAMWHSRASKFNIIDHTSFKRDILAELAAACRKHNIKLGVYYSHARDWYHPGGALGLSNMQPWDPAQRGGFPAYIRGIAVPQVRELLTGYGPVSILWWDTPDRMTPELAAEFEPLLALQPGILTNSRLLDRTNTTGDFSTPEKHIPARRPHGRDMEVCMTMNNSWGFNPYDTDWKSPRQLLLQLIETASKGGNYLLNIGPRPDGAIPGESIARLTEIGAWLDKHAAAIRDTGEGPFRYWENGYATRRGNTIFLHIANWPDNNHLSVPLANVALDIHPLNAPAQKLPCKPAPHGLVIDLAGVARDPHVTVLALKIDSAPEPLGQGRKPSADGSFHLDAASAEIHGLALRRSPGAVTGFGHQDNYFISWPVYLAQPGRYLVEVNYTCAQSKAGGEFEIRLNEQTLTRPVPAHATKGTKPVGAIDITSSGTVEVSFRLPRRLTPNSLQFHSLALSPVRH